MPEQVNPATPTTPAINPPQTKKPINWKLIGIITLVAAFLIGIVVFVAASLVFIKVSEPVQDTITTTKQGTPSVNRSKENPKAIFNSPGVLKNKIAFIRSESIDSKDSSSGTATRSEYDIFVINPDGSGLIKVVDNKDQFWSNDENADYWGIESLAWSPKGNYLAWIRSGKSNLFEFIKTVDKSKVAEIKSSKGKSITGFSISPDEKKVALVESYKSNSLNYTAADIRVIDLITKKEFSVFNVVRGTGDENEYIFMDSNHIDWMNTTTIATLAGDKKRVDLVSFDINLGLSAKKIIIRSSDSIFSLNKTKDKIVYWDKGSSEPASDIIISDLNGDNKQKIAILDGIYPRAIKFSPNSLYISYVGNNAEAVEFGIVNLSDNKKTIGKVYGIGFDWRPDSASLATLDGLYSNNLAVVDLRGKIIKQLTKRDDTQKIYYYSPVWFPQ